VVFAALCAFLDPAGAASTPAVSVYDATATPLPGNMLSVGAEADSFNEFGDEVTLAGTARVPTSVIVTLSSWACQSGAWNTHDCVSAAGATFSVPITLNLYSAATLQSDGTVLPGGLIATVTQTFAVPYRPSATLKKCNNGTTGTLGEWWDRTSGTCRNGKAVNVVFNLKTVRHLTLPDTVVIGVSYNTTHYGYNPIGESASCFGTASGCPYDSLNIALNDGTSASGTAPSVGSKPFPDTVFQNAAVQSDYCDSTPAVGVFNLDSPTNACWGGLVPAFKIVAH
jgi:hypothetical protein